MTLHPARRNDPCPCGSGRRFKHCCGAPQPNTEPDRLYQHGLALERAGSWQEAAACFARILRAEPRRLDAANRLSGLLTSFGQREAAVRCLLHAAGPAPDSVAGWLAHARAFGLQEHHAEAEHALRAALRIDPRHAEAWRLLATILRIRGMFPEATAALAEALRLAPDHAAALADYVQSARITPADAPLVHRIESLLSGSMLPPRQRIALGFALGKAFDDLDDPARAIAAFDAANQLAARALAFDRADCERQVDRIIGSFSAGRIASAGGSGGGRAILIVGMPRSGTTLVEHILSSHPAVAAGGERGFWGDWGARWDAAAGAGTTDQLLRDLGAAHAKDLDSVSPTALRVIDKNTFNIAWLGLIRVALPDAYIIHCRRDPVDTCLSAYMTPFTGSVAFSTSRANLVFYYRQYQRIMAHWSAVLPRRRMLDVSYESLVANPEAEIRRLLACCDLPWDDACLHPEQNRRAVHTASVTQVREPIRRASRSRSRRYAPYLGELAALLPGEAGSACPVLAPHSAG